MKHIALTENQVETLHDSLSHYNILLKRQIAVCESRGPEEKHAADILKEEAHDISGISAALRQALIRSDNTGGQAVAGGRGY